MGIVMGTAGHIDHGKTALIRKLTGIDCDRLEEEKRRGITIELGFAFCELPSGGRLGIVDVPGHEKFVKNMVAGASGIDFVMLVIAADEGVMPQTREHLEICSLLGIKHGLVALTKIDMVDAEWLKLVKGEIDQFLKGTFLENAPCFPVSSLTGQGIDDLRNYLIQQEKTLVSHHKSDLFRLPIDRVFTLKGHGTVVTGTMISGVLHIGDTVEILPEGRLSKVRSLQSHGQSVETATSGRRTAVNLGGIEVDDVHRGDVLALPHVLFAADRWLLRLFCLPSTPRALKNRGEIHFHHGAKEVEARLVFFDRDQLNPGESALCEARLGAPLVGVFGDHCVIRTFSPLRTVAGGLILQPLALPFQRRNATPERLELLAKLPELPDRELLTAQMKLISDLTPTKGVSRAKLAVLTNLDLDRLDVVLQTLSEEGKIYCYDQENRSYIDAHALAELSDRCLATAKAFHEKDPLKQGMARGVLLGKGYNDTKLADFILDRLLQSGTLVAYGEVIRLATHRVSLRSDQEKLKKKLLKAYADAGLTPPNFKELVDSLKVNVKTATEMMRLLLEEGNIIKVKDGLYYHAPLMSELEDKIRLWFQNHDDLDLAGFREVSGGLSRKYLIALLEYFDRTRITIRVGNTRQLRAK